MVTLLLISSINYFLIEKPARIYSGSLPYIFILFGSCVIFSVFIIFNGGKYDTSSFNPTIWSGFYYDSAPQMKRSNTVINLRKEWMVLLFLMN